MGARARGHSRARRAAARRRPHAPDRPGLPRAPRVREGVADYIELHRLRESRRLAQGPRGSLRCSTRRPRVSKVLFLSLVGPPDGVSTARLVGSLARGLHQHGHVVTVLTTAPHYNRDLDAEREQPIKWGRLGIVGRSWAGGVSFLHIAMPRKGRSVPLRVLGWLWFHAVSTALA